MELDIESLSIKSGIPAEEAEGIWQDFVNEVKKTIEEGGEFLYPDIVDYPSPLKVFSSEYVIGLINGTIDFEEYVEKIEDKRKANFARVVYYILDQASYGPVEFDELGTFFLFGRLPRFVKNPQTGEMVKTPLAINLGIKFKS